MSISKKRAADGPSVPSKTKKRKPNSHGDESLDTEAGVNTLFEQLDSQLLADHYAQKLSRFGGDLSSVELSDLTVSANAIRDTTTWSQGRTLEKLPDFIEEFSGDAASLKKAPKKNGSPHTLIVAGAGLRSANIVRAVRKFQSKENPVTKLFAKHMKIKEQTSLLQSKPTGIGVGTPQRLIDLIENGSLSLGKLQRIVIDASHIDQKKRGMMDMAETMMPLARLLTRKELKDKYVDEKKPVAVMFY